jgi:hypothetical protein
MSDFGFTFKVKNLFFDRPAVINAVGRARASSLARVGAYIRIVARRSMRRRRAIAEPGKPPSAHAGDLKEKIYFAYDSSSESVVAGPVKFKEGIVPGLLEFGGEVARHEKTKSRTLHYRGNPYMGAALDTAIDEGKIPSYWADSIRRPQ